jgi:hypothetical protein
MRNKYTSNFKFVCALFRALNKNTDPAIILHFLHLIKDRPIKVWFLNGVQKPKCMQDSTDLQGNIRITSSLEEIIRTISSKNEWLVGFKGSTRSQLTGHTPKKENKQNLASLAISTPPSQREKKQVPKPIKTSPRHAQGLSHTKLQEKHATKKQIQQSNKPHRPSFEGSTILTAAGLPSEKLVPATPLQPTPGTALSLLPTIE